MTGVTPTGEVEEVEADWLTMAQQKFAEEIRVAMLAGDHVWISVVTHRVSSQVLLAEEPTHLNSETVRMVQSGCYVCEKPFDPRLAGRRCQGEPKGGGGPWRGRRGR